MVTNMRHMFDGARAFNKDILGWDTSRVGDSHCIFCYADAWDARFEGGGSSTLSDRGWTRRDDACDASLPPVNGDVGNCNDTLASGTSRVPECNTGYVLEGRDDVHWPDADRSCLVRLAFCRTAPS